MIARICTGVQYEVFTGSGDAAGGRIYGDCSDAVFLGHIFHAAGFVH